METKEAIEFCEKGLLQSLYPRKACRNSIKKVIALLKQGKAYKSIVDNLGYGFKNHKFFFTAITEDTPIKYAEYFLDDLKEKYLKEE